MAEGSAVWVGLQRNPSDPQDRERLLSKWLLPGVTELTFIRKGSPK